MKLATISHPTHVPVSPYAPSGVRSSCNRALSSSAGVVSTSALRRTRFVEGNTAPSTSKTQRTSKLYGRRSTHYCCVCHFPNMRVRYPLPIFFTNVPSRCYASIFRLPPKIERRDSIPFITEPHTSISSGCVASPLSRPMMSWKLDESK